MSGALLRTMLEAKRKLLGERLIGQAIDSAGRRGLLRPEELGVAKARLGDLVTA